MRPGFTSPHHHTTKDREPAGLASRNRLSFASGEALSSIGRNGSVNDGATVNALPGVENEKKI